MEEQEVNVIDDSIRMAPEEDPRKVWTSEELRLHFNADNMMVCAKSQLRLVEQKRLVQVDRVNDSVSTRLNQG